MPLPPLLLQSFLLSLLQSLSLFVGQGAAAAPPAASPMTSLTTAMPSVGANVAVVGILDGSATVLRQALRFALAEGVVLQADDIVQTGPASFVQLELTDGVLLGVGEGSQLLVAPKWSPSRGGAAARAYVMEGWVKLVQPDGRKAADVLLSPGVSIECLACSAVMRFKPGASVVFVESGAVKWVDRGAPKAVAVTVKANEFAAQRGDGKLVLAERPSAEFLQAMPRFFRDRLPSQAAKFASQRVVPKALATPTYEELTPWLKAETGLRLALLNRWKPLAGDRPFRNAVASHLNGHPEWEPVLFPERFMRRGNSWVRVTE